MWYLLSGGATWGREQGSVDGRMFRSVTLLTYINEVFARTVAWLDWLPRASKVVYPGLRGGVFKVVYNRSISLAWSRGVLFVSYLTTINLSSVRFGQRCNIGLVTSEHKVQIHIIQMMYLLNIWAQIQQVWYLIQQTKVNKGSVWISWTLSNL